MAEGTELALDAADAEAARYADRVYAAEVLRRRLGGGAVITGDPTDPHAAVLVEPACAQGLGHREVGIRQVDVLADKRDLDLVRRMVHAAQQIAPTRPVDVTEGQAEAAHDVGIESLRVEDLGDVIDARRVNRRHDSFLVDVAHQRDLALDAGWDRAVRAENDRIGLDADIAQLRH